MAPAGPEIVALIPSAYNRSSFRLAKHCQVAATECNRREPKTVRRSREAPSPGWRSIGRSECPEPIRPEKTESGVDGHHRLPIAFLASSNRLQLHGAQLNRRLHQVVAQAAKFVLHRWGACGP